MAAGILLGIVALAGLAVLVLPALGKFDDWDHRWRREHAALSSMTHDDSATASPHVRVVGTNVRPVPTRQRQSPEPGGGESESQQQAA